MNIEVQRPYRHFKGKLYYVHSIVTHTETRETLVSYQALYPPYGINVGSRQDRDRQNYVYNKVLNS